MNRILKFFDAYSKIGWEIIPLLPRSKKPFMKGWNKNYNHDQIRSYLELHPNCNIGLLLGGIIDVEADSEAGNDLLDKLIKNYPHPKYQSEKSVHHLFLSHDISLTRYVARGIEFRGFKHQSMLPPSVNASGIEYTWLPSKFPIPSLPDSLINLYNGLDTINPWCSQCGNNVLLNKKRCALEMEAFKRLGMKWQCHKCRNIDVRKICRKIKPSALL